MCLFFNIVFFRNFPGQEYIDPSSGCPYYYNLLTGETTWERPDTFKSATVVSAIAAAAAENKDKKNQEKLATAQESGEVGAAFLLERWRRVAWREGMRRVVANQKAKSRKVRLPFFFLIFSFFSLFSSLAQNQDVG